MPRRLAAGNAQDLVQAERDIRSRIGAQHLDFAAMAAVSNIYRAANIICNYMEREVLAEEDLSWVLNTLEKRRLIRRRAHAEDGRLVLVSLEPKGQAVVEQMFPAFNMGET